MGRMSQIDVLTGDQIMASKMPPVPPDNQSRKGTGDRKQMSADQMPHGQERVQNPDQQGQQGNIKQNTTNQGYQQNR
ncbi:hypothetical protein ABIA06_000536 [Bradyrhizobium yuanmingense]